MTNLNKILDDKYQLFDDEYEIILTQTVNLYDNILIFKDIKGFVFIFRFEKDDQKKDTGIKIENKENQSEIILTNFNNVLGAATTKRVKIIDLPEGKGIYFSVSARGLNESIDFLQVTVTFYQK